MARRFEKRVVKLKNIFARYGSQFINVKDLLSKRSDLHAKHPFKDSKYKWSTLLDSIKEEGLQNPIRCDIDPNKNNTYHIFDGEHRYLALKSLYDEDYKIEILVSLRNKS